MKTTQKIKSQTKYENNKQKWIWLEFDSNWPNVVGLLNLHPNSQMEDPKFFVLRGSPAK